MDASIQEMHWKGTGT